MGQLQSGEGLRIQCKVYIPKPPKVGKIMAQYP